MNTPRTKPPKRWKLFMERKPVRFPISGTSSVGLNNPQFLGLIGVIATKWPFLDEAMADIFRELLGVNPLEVPYRQILRSIINAKTRIDIMRALLEDNPKNMAKGKEYDGIIDEFHSLTKNRNSYLHGLWSTHESGRIFLSAPHGDQQWYFDTEREVQSQELVDVIGRMDVLREKIRKVTFDGLAARISKHTASLPTSSPPPSSKSKKARPKSTAPKPARPPRSSPRKVRSQPQH